MDKPNPIVFKFKSTKGQDITINYEPKDVNIPDLKAFEKHMLKVVDYIQIDDKPKEQVKPQVTEKSIEDVAKETKTNENQQTLF